MNKISKEYQLYQEISVMQKLATYAHESHYIGQTSSATFQEVAEIFEQIPLLPTDTVYDLGCGNGSFSIKIAETFNCSVAGVDLSSKLIELANSSSHNKQRLKKCNFICDDFTSLNKLSKQKANVICCIGSLYWGISIKETINTWHTHLLNDGNIVIFSNLKIHELDDQEQTNVGETKFICENELNQVLSQLNLRVTYCDDRTLKYILWLEKWCEGMKVYKHEISKELGHESGLRMQRRFETYLRIAKGKKVLRKVIVAKKGSL